MSVTTPKRSVLVAINDLHVGSPYAVTPDYWLTQDRLPIQPNELQRVINAHWLDCWRKVAALRKGAHLIVLVLGDVIEGLHHETTQVTTTRIDTQEDMACAVLETGLKIGRFRWHGKDPDTIRFYAGTDAHDGNSGASLERVARRVLDLDAQDSRKASYHLGRISINGVRFDVTHKPGSGPGSRAQTHGNAFGAWLKSLYLVGLEGGAWPRYVLTAHHHQYLRRDVYSVTGGEVVMTGFILPSFKVQDDHIKTVAPFALASVGMVAFEIGTAGAVTEHDWRIPIEQDEVEEL